MKLYTINATPWQAVAGDDYNNHACETYPSRVAKILSEHKIDGFTIYEVMGYWQGKPERSFKIEIAIEPDTMEMIDICKILKTRFGQDSVMLTMPNGEVTFI